MTRSHTINSHAVRDREKERKRERERICGISEKHFSPHLSDLLACFVVVVVVVLCFFCFNGAPAVT